MNPTPPKTLIDLSLEAMQLEKAILELGDDSTEINQFLDNIKENLATKADNYHFTMKRLKYSAAMLKEKAELFSKASRSLDQVEKKMKERIKMAMTILDSNEIKGSDIVFKLSKNDPKIKVDLAWLPSEYKKERISFEIDIEKIEKETEQGIVISGVELEPSYTLRTSVNKGDL
jgi:hypothetical protein